MQFRKPLIAASMAATLLVGGAGVASAQYGGDAEEPTVEVETEVVDSDVEAVQVQDETDDVVADTEGDEDGRRGSNCGKNHEVAAEAIGISVEELQAALEDGSTIADVAEDNGVAVQDVINAMVENAEERLAAKVEEGRLSAEEAAEKLETKTEKITDRVNGIDDDNDDDDDDDDAEEIDA